MAQLLQILDVNKTFKSGNSKVKACQEINLTIGEGEVVGLVGESGSGKSTLANLVLGLEKLDSGSIKFEGVELEELLKDKSKSFRREVQAVFQHPLLSLDSRKTIAWSIAEPLVINKIGNSASRKARVLELLAAVALDEGTASKYPSQLSGGQLQRVNIARALALEPKLIICDEPVSALDVSVQAQIVNLFLDIQKRLGVAMLFISHDLAVVRHISDRIAVMYAGKIMEIGDTDDICESPIHPYTQALLSASTFSEESDEGREKLKLFRREEVPQKGCPFSTRCPHAIAVCREEEIKIQSFASNRESSCLRVQEIFPNLAKK